MSLAHSPAAVGIELVASSIWVGSLVSLAVVSRAASASLDPEARIASFRALGLRDGIVGSVALFTAIGIGVATAWPPDRWSKPVDACVALAGLLVILTVLGMSQAKRMSRVRRNALTDLGNSQLVQSVAREAKLAADARGLIAGVTLEIVVIAAFVIAD